MVVVVYARYCFASWGGYPYKFTVTDNTKIGYICDLVTNGTPFTNVVSVNNDNSVMSNDALVTSLPFFTRCLFPKF